MDGHSAAIVWRWSEGRVERLPALAREIVGLDPDVIVASSTAAIRALRQATRSMPIVMANSTYPDRIGLVDSLARPGGNVTGLDNVGPELKGRQVQLLREVAPRTVPMLSA